MASSKHLVLPLKPINIKKPNTRPYIYKERYDYYGLYKTDERLTRWHKYYRDWVQERYEKKPFIKYNVMRQGGYPLVSNRFAEPWKSKNEQVKPSSPQYSQNGEFNLGLAPILPHRERRCSTYGQNRIWQNTYYPPNIGNQYQYIKNIQDYLKKQNNYRFYKNNQLFIHINSKFKLKIFKNIMNQIDQNFKNLIDKN